VAILEEKRSDDTGGNSGGADGGVHGVSD